MLVNRLCRGRIYKHGVWEWDPILELIITSSYLIVDSHVSLSTPTITIADECFHNHSKMEQPIGKGRVQGRGGSWLYVWEYAFNGAWEKSMPKLI
jgi:hypothetical protein